MTSSVWALVSPLTAAQMTPFVVTVLFTFFTAVLHRIRQKSFPRKKTEYHDCVVPTIFMTSNDLRALPELLQCLLRQAVPLSTLATTTIAIVSVLMRSMRTHTSYKACC